MALIKCPECKKKISDQCANCLHCGYPIQENLQQQDCDIRSTELKAPKKINKKTGWIIGIIILCVVLAATAATLLSQGIFTPEPVPFSENTAAIEAADASVVKIFCYDHNGELAATGSGFIVYDSKTVVTNYHVMASAYTCKISTNQDVSYEVDKILCYSKEQDLAILQLDKDTEIQPLILGTSADIKKGETVVAIGSPLGIKNTVSMGVLSGRPTENNIEVLQFTAPISSGSSGGALFDNNGKVIGVTYSSYIDGQNINLAIPAELVSALYTKKAGPRKVSKIYTIEHPYVDVLADYNDIPTVTLADLKQNPELYNNKVIRMSIYASSSGKNSKYWWDEHTWYFSEKSNISLNYEYDSNLDINQSFRRTPLLQCNILSDDAKYIDSTLVPGDKIEVIGKLDFHPMGEETNVGSYPHDTASLDAILIWKE